MSGKILELKRWERITYHPDGPGGPEISMEIKRLQRHEARALRKVCISVFEQSDRSKEPSLTAYQKAEIMSRIFDVVPDEDLAALFEHVRNVQGLEIDGVPVTTGPELLKEPDDTLLFFVLTAMQNLAGLTPMETFRSGSRSGSPAETASLPASHASDVASTGNGDGIAPSTVTSTGATPASSFAPAAEE